MRQYVMRRLLLMPILLLGITALDFCFINLAPGDPVSAMINPNEMRGLSKEAVEARRRSLGLDRPIYVRYAVWLKELGRGNLGYSIVKAQPVARMMKVGIKNTITLMALSMVVTTVVGITLGVVSALRPYSVASYALTAVAFAGVATPSFFLALMLILVGALKLGWFPTSGLHSPGAPPSVLDQLHHMVLPLIALSIGGTASLLRYTRSGMLEVLHEDYVTTARAKGLRERVVIARHAFKNALLPVITVLGLYIPSLFGGSVIVETIFNIPGIGSTTVEAMNTRDYPLIMGSILVSGVLVLVSSLVADIGYAMADPRIRY